jgi:DNA-binding HxlR family transcriptional regulator
MIVPTETTHCPAKAGIEALQDRWVLHIVSTLLEGPKGFNAIGRAVGGCSPTTLTHRLTRLESLGIIAKAEGKEGCRACYRLTESGAELNQVISAIRDWADNHLSDQPPRRDEATGVRQDITFF